MTDSTTPALLTYDRALSPIRGWWRGLLAIVTFIVGFLIISAVVGGAGIFYEYATGGLDFDALASGVVPMTPAIMLTNNLSLAAAIPLAFLLQRAFFGVKGGWLSSVTGRFRWRWMGKLALIIVPLWAVYVGASIALDPSGEWRLDGPALVMIAIIVLTTPLQSAGEEYGARGLILRSAGSWFRNPILAFVVATVISSSVFALAHFAADPWLIAYYFVFGASAAIAARGTGGLEAPVLVHATNNVLLLIPAALLGQLAEGFDRSEGAGGPFMLLPMAMCVAAAVLSTWWARRTGQVTAAAAAPSAADSLRVQQSALSFGRAVEAYDAARPAYPTAAAEWLVPSDARDVLELGAGTGKFTRSLVERGLTVVAVDPDVAMLHRLSTNLPTVRALPGTAEAIPLPDDSVDAVVLAQAWHWVDPVRALPEIARVLRPGGTLGLVWNVRDESIPWVRALSEIAGVSAAERYVAGPVAIGAPFGATETMELRWTAEFTPTRLLELVASRSAIIAADNDTRENIFAAVRALLANDPELAGRESFNLPYVTHAFRATLQ